MRKLKENWIWLWLGVAVLLGVLELFIFPSPLVPMLIVLILLLNPAKDFAQVNQSHVKKIDTLLDITLLSREEQKTYAALLREIRELLQPVELTTVEHTEPDSLLVEVHEELKKLNGNLDELADYLWRRNGGGDQGTS